MKNGFPGTKVKYFFITAHNTPQGSVGMPDIVDIKEQEVNETNLWWGFLGWKWKLFSKLSSENYTNVISSLFLPLLNHFHSYSSSNWLAIVRLFSFMPP